MLYTKRVVDIKQVVPYYSIKVRLYSALFTVRCGVLSYSSNKFDLDMW